jgi:hypothetical protein
MANPNGVVGHSVNCVMLFAFKYLRMLSLFLLLKEWRRHMTGLWCGSVMPKLTGGRMHVACCAVNLCFFVVVES